MMEVDGIELKFNRKLYQNNHIRSKEKSGKIHKKTRSQERWGGGMGNWHMLVSEDQ